ncbi:MAG: TonB-dependent receptor, partial [Bacteroidota bacterium]
MSPAVRLVRLLALACLVATLGGGAAFAQDEAPSASSPEAIVWAETPLSDALYAFSEASGVEIVFALRLVRDVRVSGRYLPGDAAGPALTALLVGTGLRAERVRRSQYVLIEEPLNIPVVGDDPSFFTGVLEGRVVDAATDEPLWGAHVWLVDLDLGDVVDARGEFAVDNLPTGTYSVRVSHIGYKPVRVELDVFPASPQLPPTVRLRPEAVTSSSATVRPQTLPPEPEPGLAVISPPGLPSATGRPALSLAGPVVAGDLFGGLSLVPGVSRASGAGGPLVVRGAAPGRAVVVRDGVPVYSVGALGATFQPEALSAARLHSGPLPVELDGGAGVLELETRTPEAQQTGVVAAGLGGLRGVVNAPITSTLGVQAGWGRPVPSDLPLASARTAGQALVVDPRSRAGTAEAESRTWDAEAKVTWTPRPAQTVEVGVYRNTETLGASLGPRLWRLHGRSDAASVRARGLVGDKTFVTGTAYGSRAVGEEAMGGLDTRTDLREWGARAEADHAFSLDHQVRVGASLAARQSSSHREASEATSQQDAVEAAVYV